jgi:hypothetical protein
MRVLAASGDLLGASIPTAKTVMLASSPGQRANELRTGDWHDFRGLCHSKLGVASGDNLQLDWQALIVTCVGLVPRSICARSTLDRPGDESDSRREYPLRRS